MERITTLTELEHFARAFISSVIPNKDRATVVTLSGELGAGKTAFVQACARVLGVTEEITSPTFVIENRYELPAGGVFSRLVHIDAYRLEGAHELEPLRFNDDLQTPRTLIMLEWPEQVEAALTTSSTGIVIRHQHDGTRQIDITHTSA